MMKLEKRTSGDYSREILSDRTRYLRWKQQTGGIVQLSVDRRGYRELPLHKLMQFCLLPQNIELQLLLAVDALVVFLDIGRSCGGTASLLYDSRPPTSCRASYAVARSLSASSLT